MNALSVSFTDFLKWSSAIPSCYRSIAQRLLLLTISLGLSTKGFAEEPWSVSSRDPITAVHLAKSKPSQAASSTPEIVAMGWLSFYQNWLSVVSQSHCRMAPSCSNFSIEAIHEHGAALGIMMTADRLLHEADEQKQNRFVLSSGLASCPDPVSNNDFWWKSKHE